MTVDLRPEWRNDRRLYVENPAAAKAIGEVIAWSRKLYGISDKKLREQHCDPMHEWTKDSAMALLVGAEPAPWPGGRAATGVSRLEVIRRILERHCPVPLPPINDDDEEIR